MEFLEHFGQVAGIAGIAIGTLLILFREVIRKNVFPQLGRTQAYRLLRLIILLTWTIALFGILAWVLGIRSGPTDGANHLLEIDIGPERLTEDPRILDSIARASGGYYETLLTYRHRREGDLVVIEPKMAYLSDLLSGKTVPSASDFVWNYPLLELKLTNNSTRTVLVTDAEFEVRRATPNIEPALTFRGGFERFFIVNEAWGQIENPTVDFALYKERVCHGYSPDPENAPLHHVELQSFDHDYRIELGSYFPAELSSIREEPDSNSCLLGTLRYRVKGVERTAKFAVVFMYGSAMLGGGRDASGLSYDVMLDAGASGYTREVPLAKELRPGESTVIPLRIAADRPVRLDLTVTLHTLGGQSLGTKDLILDILVFQRSWYPA